MASARAESPLVSSLLYIIHTLVLLWYRVHTLSVKDRLQPVETSLITVFESFQSKLTSNRTAVSVTYYFQKLDQTEAWTAVRSSSVLGLVNCTLKHYLRLIHLILLSFLY